MALAALVMGLVATCAPRLASAQVAQNTLVRINTSAGAIDIDLFDNVTPLTVNNLKSYMNLGTYQDSIMHRSVPGFIIQGGGYLTSDFAANPLPNSPTHVTQLPAVLNEFKLTNKERTIAMAKPGNNPNGATTEWFINLVDNGSNLDSQNGGFTAFGQVVNGMDVANTIANASIYPPTLIPFPGVIHNPPFDPSPFATVPRTSAGQFVNVSNITVVRTHPAYQNPNVTISAERALDVNNDDLLSSADANQIINRLIVGHGPHAITVADLSDTYQYIDIDGNGQVTAFDAVQVVNHLIVNAQPAQSLTLSADSPWFDAVPLASVPEPSSWVLGTLAALVLAGYAVRRRRAARRA